MVNPWKPERVITSRVQTKTNMNLLSPKTQKATTILVWLVFIASSLVGVASTMAADKNRPEHFLPEERRIIREYYHRSAPSKGLPPGLAKKGKLPPGLQKHLVKNGRLPPGLQKRLEPLPRELDARLPRLPDFWERIILERDIILIDRRTNRILDIIENVIGLATGR